MPCACKIINAEATIGSTFSLQFRLKEEDGTVIDLTEYRVAMAARGKDGAFLFTADSDDAEPSITLDAAEGALIHADVPETVMPQVADFNVLVVDAGGKSEAVIRGTITLHPQITDLTP